MHRFYLPPEQCHGDTLTLNERESHHALNVLRVRQGERLVVLNGAGQEILCEARSPANGQLALQVAQRNSIPPLPWQLTLLQAVPKGRIMDAIVQKATELGVHRIVPLFSDRVVSQLDDESAASRAEQWQRTAIEAVKQCGSPWLPRVEAPVSPKDYLSRAEKFELPLIASLQADRRHPREYFKRFYDDNRRLPATLCVWIGPEGDFTPAELNAIKSSGALPITLGRLVLRSETAATYALSVLNYELQSDFD